MTDISIPNSFVLHTKADPALVNENFTTISDFINTTGVPTIQPGVVGVNELSQPTLIRDRIDVFGKATITDTSEYMLSPIGSAIAATNVADGVNYARYIGFADQSPTGIASLTSVIVTGTTAPGAHVPTFRLKPVSSVAAGVLTLGAEISSNINPTPSAVNTIYGGSAGGGPSVVNPSSGLYVVTVQYATTPVSGSAYYQCSVFPSIGG